MWEDKSPQAPRKESTMAEAKKTPKTAKEVAKTEEVKEVVDTVAEETTSTEVKKEVKTTKAGKHSAKALKEEAEKEAKEQRKAEAKAAEGTEEAKPKAKPAPKTRSLLERRGKNYREKAKNVDVNKEYSLGEAISVTSKSSPVKFDATVELHVRLNVDPRQADQNIRGNVTLPAGTGKTVRIAVFAEGDDVEKAKKAGADIVGVEEVENLINKGTLDFDVLIATPMLMAKLGKHARVLGPRGLMPNPKSGTVTPNVAKAVAESKAGKVEYRVDSTGIVHLGVGKVSFEDAKLKQNIDTVIASIKANKPNGIKGNYFKSMYLTSSMGPSVRVVVSDLN